MTLEQIKEEMRKLADPERAKLLQRYFKTGKGEYAEGDIFIGLTIPQLRAIAKKYADIGSKDVQQLLNSKIHEERQAALFILTMHYQKAQPIIREKIVYFYLKNTKNINNWDLIDLSAPKILGDFLLERDKSILYTLAMSQSIWERRIAIMSTFAFIHKNQFDASLKISEILLKDKHDLIHKAVGWMLREIGKRSIIVEEKFLRQHCRTMPRTMLRYAIEKFPEKKRKKYLTQK